LIIAGCARDVQYNAEGFEYRIDPRLQFYVDDFYKEAEKRKVFLKKENLIVEIVDIPDELNAIGLGTIRASGQRIVQIDNMYFELNKYHYYSMEMLMFHELGHTLLKRPHNNHYSVMNTLAPKYIYVFDKELRKILLHELFYGDSVNILKK
jgi:hypothetical protein